jgi:hypothetical protein
MSFDEPHESEPTKEEYESFEKELTPPGAICGACGKRFAEHIREQYSKHEVRYYCNTETTGDVFTDEPDDATIIMFMETHYPSVFELMKKLWRKSSGYESESA